MDPNLVFWSAALANLGVIVVCCFRGVVLIRARNVAGHRRMMLTAISLVVLFLVSYGFKVGLLGREDKSNWLPRDFVVLYVHEFCVVAMLAGAGVALYRAAKFRSGLGPGLALPPDERPLEGLRAHRRAGWVAVVGGLLGFVTAAGVLAGMFARAE